MYRSFTDRVLGGVCGGLGASLRLNAWWVRGVFTVLTLVSLGIFAATYALLWWLVPQESFARTPRRFPALLVFGLLLLSVLASVGIFVGWWVTPTGVSLLYPGLLLILSVVFLLRQFARAV
ncbi:MAG: PspC domain-containing protein [Chloroflexi bacterium]|nr:PspC domain-containing protein [Chloroflexota bacterium]